MLMLTHWRQIGQITVMRKCISHKTTKIELKTFQLIIAAQYVAFAALALRTNGKLDLKETLKNLANEYLFAQRIFIMCTTCVRSETNWRGMGVAVMNRYFVIM